MKRGAGAVAATGVGVVSARTVRGSGMLGVAVGGPDDGGVPADETGLQLCRHTGILHFHGRLFAIHLAWLCSPDKAERLILPDSEQAVLRQNRHAEDGALCNPDAIPAAGGAATAVLGQCLLAGQQGHPECEDGGKTKR